MTNPKHINRIAILVNQEACNGQARKKWKRIREDVLGRLPDDTIEIPFGKTIDMQQVLQDLIAKEGVDFFISAGGDGSVNYLLNGLMNLPEGYSPGISMGAIGLGSSNDFHKPFKKTIKKVPVRINLQKPCLADVGRVDFTNTRGEQSQRFFIVNASMGVIAAANHLFNQGDSILGLLKGHMTPLAIIYAAVKTILTYRNYKVRITFKDHARELLLSNLSILKNPHVSGSFCYDQKIGIADGILGLNYCDNMNKRELIQAMYDLGKGRFQGPEKRHSTKLQSLQVDVAQPVPVEVDGEVFIGTDFKFSVIPKAINLLSNES